MPLYFPFKREQTPLFGHVYRPYAIVSFWSNAQSDWSDIALIVDSGADYTLLPKFYTRELGIDVKKDTREYSTRGVGGSSRVFFLQKKQKIKLGSWERTIPLGFIDNNEVPPLLGRQEFLEVFKCTFHHHVTEIDSA